MSCASNLRRGQHALCLTLLFRYRSLHHCYATNELLCLHNVFIGKVFVPKEEPVVQEREEDVILDVEEEGALKTATDADLVDLAGILGFHSMLNQEQYYAAITMKGQKQEGGTFQSIAKAPLPKVMPPLPDNDTDVQKTAQQVADNDPNLKELNWNNIKHIPRDIFKKLFDGLKNNTHLEKLSISNTGLTDGPTAVRGFELLRIFRSIVVSTV